MTTVYCLLIWIVVTTIEAIYKTRNRRQRDSHEQTGCFLFSF